MRINRPQAPRFTRRQDLRGIVVRMISLNSLAAFTAEVSRLQGPAQARAAASAASPGVPPVTPLPQRPLEAVPPAPSGPMPRGSLLDLRV